MKKYKRLINRKKISLVTKENKNYSHTETHIFTYHIDRFKIAILTTASRDAWEGAPQNSRCRKSSDRGDFSEGRFSSIHQEA